MLCSEQVMIKNFGLLANTDVHALCTYGTVLHLKHHENSCHSDFILNCKYCTIVFRTGRKLEFLTTEKCFCPKILKQKITDNLSDIAVLSNLWEPVKQSGSLLHVCL